VEDTRQPSPANAQPHNATQKRFNLKIQDLNQGVVKKKASEELHVPQRLINASKQTCLFIMRQRTSNPG
jgi:hypothetical protein